MDNSFSNNKIIIEIQCVGNIFFWHTLLKNSEVNFEYQERYQKSGFRNKYHVLGSNGVICLSIPLKGGRETKELTCEVLIDNTSNWQKNHWKTLESCYNKSPFFYHYSHSLLPFYQKPYQFLWDFNMEIFEWVLGRLKVEIKVGLTQHYQKEIIEENIIDLRGKLKNFTQNLYQNEPYLQVFEINFKQNLSILDLLFNLGPNSTSYLLE